jgi:hypothetical protein
MNLRLILKTNAMFDMIVYVSVPYSPQHPESLASARLTLQKYFAAFYKANPKCAAVNAVFSFPNNVGALTDKEVFTAVAPLMRSASKHIILIKPNWGYSPIATQECALAYNLNIPTLIEAF